MIEKKSNFNKRIHYETTISVSEFVLILSSIDAVKKFKKKQKKIDKKIESQSLIEMFNKFKKTYDKSISVRQIFRKNKIDLF